MEPSDLTPHQARAAGYDHVLAYHCQVLVVVWADGLPERPLSEMRFRCSACGSRRVQVRPAWHTKGGMPTR